MPPQQRSPRLDRGEYIEQAYLFDLLADRSAERIPMQDLLDAHRHELLATTKLPIAVDYLLTELKHSGTMAPAMRRLSHYFTPFQTFLMEQAESETGRFAMHVALQILLGDAKFRCDDRFDHAAPAARGDQAEPGSTADSRPQAAFFFQFEVLCRNRLSYDRGLTAMSGDPIYDDDFAAWILQLRADVGLVDLSDLLYLSSRYYRDQLIQHGLEWKDKGPFLFGVKEGRIAFANRRKEPLYLFSAMQRHLGYPPVPRPKAIDETIDLIPQLSRRIERLESRIKLMEQEQKQSLDITKFYGKPS